ncbi:MAG: sulfatase-like hydrolase/transferase [Planctomycetes bacterium]|nr:sulfatase-like hydrolase/transferase [Planctomycetota bacterium]
MLLLTALTPLAADERPNFVVIMADDLGYGDLGCYGNERIETPQLDRLAAEGMRLTDFHSSGAVCSPTRAGLLTGRYQQRAGIPSVIVADPQRETHPHGLQDREATFAELLSAAGYKTAIFGKWHLGYYRKYNPVRHGFGRFRGYVSGNVDFFSHVDQAGRLDWWRDEQIDDEPGYTTHLITEDAVSFIAANHDEPFCLYVPYEPPHYPYQGPNDEPVRTVGKPRGKAELDQSAQEIQRAYKEMVEELDKGVGEIVAALKKHGVERQTLVLFFSDNGATRHGSNGPLRGFKGQLWEGGHRVPCIAWRPGTISAGSDSAELTITLDVMPTLLSAAGVNPPEDRKLDGADLLPLLTKGESLPPRHLFWGHGDSRAIRDGPWKLIVNAPGRKQPGLFNLAEDIAEQHDLAQQEPARMKEMRAAIQTWERDIAADATPQPDAPPREAEKP